MAAFAEPSKRVARDIGLVFVEGDNSDLEFGEKSVENGQPDPANASDNHHPGLQFALGRGQPYGVAQDRIPKGCCFRLLAQDCD